RPTSKLMARPLAPARGADEVGDQVEACVDLRRIRERGGELGGEPPRAGAGQRVVDGREQRAAPRAVERLVQLELAPGRRVDLEEAALGMAYRRVEPRQPALLREVDIIDQTAAGGELGAAERAEAVERLHAVEGF